MNIRKLIERLTSIADEIELQEGHGAEWFDVFVRYKTWDEDFDAYINATRPIRRVGYDEAGAYLSLDPLPRADTPEDIAAEREAGRERARALLLGETIFGNTRLAEDDHAITSDHLPPR